MVRPNILERFRPVGAPGAAGPAGVPSDDVRGPAWELAPLFDALRPDVEAAQTAIDIAVAAAQKSRRDAETRAAEIRTEASLEAKAARAGAASRVARAAEHADAEYAARAETTGAALAEAAAEQLESVAAHVLTALMTDLSQS
jgi:hypothetical protein